MTCCTQHLSTACLPSSLLPPPTISHTPSCHSPLALAFLMKQFPHHLPLTWWITLIFKPQLYSLVFVYQWILGPRIELAYRRCSIYFCWTMEGMKQEAGREGSQLVRIMFMRVSYWPNTWSETLCGIETVQLPYRLLSSSQFISTEVIFVGFSNDDGKLVGPSKCSWGGCWTFLCQFLTMKESDNVWLWLVVSDTPST